jgi:catechol 2,3-dioxygenase-like lactoylglutathione lyase family enzyme
MSRRLNLYPIVTTPEPGQCRDFYVRAFDARVLFDKDWFVHLAIDQWELGFLKPDPPVPMPMFRHASPSRGLCLAVEVERAGELLARLRERGIEPLGRPQQSPSGEIAFSVMDPAGVILNVVELGPATAEVLQL